MQVHKGDLGDFYGTLVNHIHRSGKILNPRNRPNREIRPVLFESSAYYPAITGPVNYRFAVAEVMAMVAGWDDVGWLARFNKNVAQFSDNGTHFRGAYGRRLYFPVDQLKIAVELFTKDPDTRQVVLEIWRPEADLEMSSKDRPCNTQLLLKVRDKTLDMTVIRRSADIVWGVPYDHFVFASFLQIFADWIFCKPGTLREYIDSLHVYEESAQFYDADRIVKAIAAKKSKHEWKWPSFGTVHQTRRRFFEVRQQLEDPSTTRCYGSEQEPLFEYLSGGNRPCW